MVIYKLFAIDTLFNIQI